MAEIPKELKHYVVTVGNNIELKRGRASHFIYETRELRRQPAERLRKALRLSSGSRYTLVSYSPKLSYDPAHVTYLYIIECTKFCI